MKHPATMTADERDRLLVILWDTLQRTWSAVRIKRALLDAWPR